MAKFHLSRIEQETVINFNAAEESVDLHTSDPTWLRKMDKLVEKNPEQFKLIRVDKCQGGDCGKALYVSEAVCYYPVRG